MTQFNNSFSEEIYKQTYQFDGDGDIDGTISRVAKTIAKVELEEKRDYWEEKFIEAMSDFKLVLGGRIFSNAGTGLKGMTLLNCYVSGFRGKHQDSMISIMGELNRQARILQSEGGYGICIDVLRPRGAFIHSIGNESPGAVKMLEMWDTQSRVITAGSGKYSDKKNAKKKIRKGAQLFSLSCWHSDIEEFITIKQQGDRLTKCNLSVLITDDFMDAVKNKKAWNLEFPDYENYREVYNEEWDGNLKKWKERGYGVKIYKTINDANELWNLIIQSTYNRNEPGVLFIDTINRLNNLYYCEHLSATNPCGEQPLPIDGSCLLLHLNLTQFIDFEKSDWNYSKLDSILETAVRLGDDVITIANVPLKEQRIEIEKTRRIGIGVLGYGSALMMMRIKYGSKEALDITNKLGEFITNNVYQHSSSLAKERGSFPCFNKEKYLEGNFIKNLSKETKKMINENGIRNSHLLTIAPTGNTSILANNVSGGLEPVFMPEYIRTVVMNEVPIGLQIPINIDFKNKIIGEKYLSFGWHWIKEGDGNLLKINFKEEIYKIEKDRGLVKEVKVQDYAVRYLKERGEWDEKADWAKSAMSLSIEEHIETMKVFAKCIDASISKTVNFSNNCSYDDFKNVYMDTYNTKIIKGLTTYREGTMSSVLATINEKEKENKINIVIAPKRPKELLCDIFHPMVKGQKWIVLIGLLDGVPYEVFAFRQSKLKLGESIVRGTLVKIKSGCYNLITATIIIEDIASFFERDEEEYATRMTSAALRHGIPIEELYEQINKSPGNIISFNKAIARVLKKYLNEDKIVVEKICPNCQQEEVLIFQEGCLKCKNCGWSKCD